ncbi:MAG: DNA gyrase C-terminal beta-propeller domain-containing protein, partial [Candidatus Fonsibacter sp.]
MLFFTSKGLVFKVKTWKIPEGTTTSKGKSLQSILTLKENQQVTSIMPLPDDENLWNKLFIIFVTAKGKIRKNNLSDFSSIQSTGKIAMK